MRFYIILRVVVVNEPMTQRLPMHEAIEALHAKFEFSIPI